MPEAAEGVMPITSCSMSSRASVDVVALRGCSGGAKGRWDLSRSLYCTDLSRWALLFEQIHRSERYIRSKIPNPVFYVFRAFN